MIDLRITSTLKEELVWQAQLKEWCAAHQVTVDTTLAEPEIYEGKKKAIGIAAIEAFLKEYKTFMDDWYDCRCNKWQEE
ncbi:hypothetical protein N7E81_18470 [Reichenbachiella carrageenanivorans]|uniref:Uncharacterized protein n=1 Tax=Reichenbachiella carrageenanivorans TaxID=2979869 RepID=A0ABY6CZL1_9BACT|nr:hypothetical protein [Reichenbachiella carrageenanivorans]UXX79341.1 hypothetical protein N7E81_18470 [Reichenbachiella carrageenanivorans]